MVFGSKMNKLIKISLSFFTLLLVFSFTNPDRKMERLVSKLWKDIEFTITSIHVEDPLESLTKLNAIYTNEGKTLLGYSCYTYSHGCRIGGCSAPSAKADDTYEVFEYIIIYDESMNILKIDISDYGGEYGYEICRAKWLRQFNGKSSGFALEENIDGISGATVSATYLIDDVNILGNYLRKLKGENLI